MQIASIALVCAMAAAAQPSDQLTQIGEQITVRHQQVLGDGHASFGHVIVSPAVFGSDSDSLRVIAFSITIRSTSETLASFAGMQMMNTAGAEAISCSAARLNPRSRKGVSYELSIRPKSGERWSEVRGESDLVVELLSR